MSSLGRVEQLIETIKSVRSVDDEADLETLGQAIQELFQSSDPARGIDAVFEVFERFHESDGYGLFWTMLHNLEQVSGFEARLIESVRRQPEEFNLTMVNRLLNSGRTSIGTCDLLALLSEIARAPKYPAAAREQALRYLERHQGHRS